jgi:ferredoxin-NADP reductase
MFDLQGQAFEYLPGQYLYYELDALAFPDERGNRRHFTISSSPTEKGVLMFTTRMRGSGFKETLRHAPIGYELTCETPLGEFVMQNGDSQRQHVFIAGGIGVTPYRSILRFAADTNEPLKVLMLCFNRSSADIVFRRELQEMARRTPTISLIDVLTEPEPGWTGQQGKFNETMLRTWVTDLYQSLFWVSGPPPIVAAFRGVLMQVGIKDEMIRTDRFIGY